MTPDPLAAVARQSRLPMLVLDPAGRIVDANPAAAALAERPAASLAGLRFAALFDPSSQAKAERMLARAWTAGHADNWELDHSRPGRLPLLMGYDASLLRDAAGQPWGVAAVGRDLTPSTALSARLAETNQQLEGALLQLEDAHASLKASQAQLVQSEKMRALGQMVAGVAHEINNPAAYVSSNLDFLARQLPALRGWFEACAPLRALAGPEQQAALEAAERAAQVETLWQDLPDLVQESQDGMARIRDIVLSLRNFSRLEEAGWTLADLNDGLHSTLRLVRPLCRDRVDITKSFALLPPILCRPAELNQVFLNLLTNAVQSISGPGQVWVSTEVADDQLAVTVRDTGAGMAPETLARLGEPFFTTKPVGSGTGLGLAVSLAIVERHQGRLRFESALGQGTTVRVEIPLERADDPG